ncbi:G2H3 [Mytilus coruscus]|uniref:G2H3 n=1 Tax=Mytilus coruscus TaxID=42192 RepID=A0A6J8BPW7_MYTCO|nr:G2H3 [Mytilus coruscus]
MSSITKISQILNITTVFLQGSNTTEKPTSTISRRAAQVESSSERKTLMDDQDKEYHRCLMLDQEKELERQKEKRNQDQEEKHSKALYELREKRKAGLVEEPADGFKIKIRTSNNWQLQCRRFKSSTRMQVISDTDLTASDDDLPDPGFAPQTSAEETIQIASHERVSRKPLTISGCKSVEELLSLLNEQVNSNKKTYVNAVRSNPMDGIFNAMERPSFNVLYALNVVFFDDIGNSEGAIDTGGLTRELFQLALQSSTELPIFEGKESSLQLRRCDIGFEDNLYFLTGQLFAMSLVFGGPAPAMMSPLMRKFVLSTDPVPTIDDIKDSIFLWTNQRSKFFVAYVIIIKDKKLGHHFILKLQLADAQTAEEACNLLEKSETLHQLMGISKPIRNKQDKENLIQKMLNFVMIENMKAAYNEYVFLKQSGRPDLMESVLVAKEQNITARTMRTYFKHIFFSEVGSNHHKLEVQRICWLEDFFVEIENETVKSTFKDIFAFTTGLKSPPPLDLNPEPSIAFLHVENLNHRLEKKDRFLPVANTCINQIKIPCNPNIRRCRQFVADLEMAFTGFEGFCDESLVQDDVLL